MSFITNYTKPELIVHLQSSDKLTAIEELARSFEGMNITSDIDELITALKEREKILSTGIGFGIAIPHAKIADVKEMAFAVGVSPEGIDFQSMDGQPVHLVILVAAGEKQHKDYLRLLSRIMTILKDEAIRSRIIESNNPQKIFDILVKEDK